MSQIPESELILNHDGSVYHLNLHPYEIAPVIINVGDPDRVSMVSNYFEKIEIKKQKREFVTHTGTYKGKRMSVISTGIGTDNIDIVYNELDALVNIDLKTRTIKEKLTSLDLVRIGTSGALQAEIEVDHFVCSRFGLGLDGLLNFYKLANTQEEEEIIHAFRKHYPNHGVLPQSYISKSSDKLFDLLSLDSFAGITASCSGFYGPQMRQLRLEPARLDMIDRLNSFRFGEHRITNFEMETGAMFGLASLLGHQCCAVNVIVANRITQKYAKDAEGSMHRLIKMTLDRLSTL
ncbi:MAG: nucleoside phosphorylase [Bacteroidetes bacterium]|nr:nucleoside phosphorylase [Bacteroidota bacterium]